MRLAPTILVLVLSFAGCGERAVDWSAPENFVYRERTAEQAGGARVEYWSLLDGPCGPFFDALADVEHYPAFVTGVDQVSLLGERPGSKTVQISQRVIGRQANATVEWTFDRDRRTIAFHTLQSDLTYDDGDYRLEESPDGRRCLVRSSYLVKDGPGVSSGALAQATRESFMSAARGVRKHVGTLARR